jgi:hypothetical protein
VLPVIYSDPAVVEAVGIDAQSADIPEIHKAVFRWMEKLVKRSWEASEDDIRELRQLGAADHEIAEWLEVACTLIYNTICADSAGAPMDEDGMGSALNRDRSFYHDPDKHQEESADANVSFGMESKFDQVVGKFAAQQVTNKNTDTNLIADAESRDLQDAALGWLAAPCTSAAYEKSATIAISRYGQVPNLFKAISASGLLYGRHQLALDLLEKPQSTTLPSDVHALVRAATVVFDQCDYFIPTVAGQLDKQSSGTMDYQQLLPDPVAAARNDEEHLILSFVEKLVRSPYKVTEKDAQSFRSAGFDETAYIDVFNTVGLQRSLDVIANCLGVAADSTPLLAR